jgi:hypothetical protein
MGMQVKLNGYFSVLGWQVCIFTPLQAERKGFFVLSRIVQQPVMERQLKTT